MPNNSKTLLFIMSILLISEASALSKEWITSNSGNDVIWLYKYTNQNNLNTKQNIVYIGDQHGGKETRALMMANGFMSQIDNTMMDRFNLYVINASNPYGLRKGIQENILNQNMNRYWNTQGQCKETDNIKKRISSLSNVIAVVDGHAYASGEMYSKIMIKSQDKNLYNDKTRICGLMKKYLPKFTCELWITDGMSDNSKASYYFVKYAKYTFAVEISQKNSTDEEAYQLGKNFNKFIAEVLK